MMASKHPVKAPMNASVIERLLKVRSPWPVRRNPVYAIAAVQRITRTGCIGNYLYRRAGERARMRSGRKQLMINLLPVVANVNALSKDTLDSTATQHQSSMSDVAYRSWT
jgi:hypothetical protein